MATEVVQGEDVKAVKFNEQRRGSLVSRGVGEDMQRGAVKVRRSVAVPALAVVGTSIQALREEHAQDEVGDEDAPYHEVINEAREVLGGRNAFKTFHEEWDAQLLIRCGETSAGDRVVLFCPFFLRTVLDDPEEMDRAFRFIMMSMDEIAMHRKYIFVYCYLGMDWSNPSLASRLRFAYDILPRKYASNLKAFYVLQPSKGFKITMWSFRLLVSREFWDKIEYINSLDEICELLHPNDETQRADLRRRFPMAVHRRDAELLGQSMPVTFGVPLRQLCLYYGVDYVDKTTGKMYPRLPPAVIFLCEALEREACEEDFSVFDASAEDIYRMVDIIDEGRPLERDVSPSSLWCILKLWVDCLPSPLFSFQAIEELQQKQVKAGDIASQRSYLIDLFHKHLPTDTAYVALYLSSFLHTMCQSFIERQDTSFLQTGTIENPPAAQEATKKNPLDPSSAARVFTPGFIRPRSMTAEMHEVIPHAVSLVETLITCAEEAELWIGSRAPPPQAASEDDDDSSSEDSDLAPASNLAADDKPWKVALEDSSSAHEAAPAAAAEPMQGTAPAAADPASSAAEAVAEEGATAPPPLQ